MGPRHQLGLALNAVETDVTARIDRRFALPLGFDRQSLLNKLRQMSNELQVTGPRHHSQATVARAKAMYVVKGIPALEVASRLNISSGTVETWVTRYKWVEERERRARRLEERAIARADQEANDFLDSMAVQAEELAEGAMEMSRKYVDSDAEFAAKNLQAASQSLKNFVDIYFRSKGLDARGPQNVSVNVQAVFTSAIRPVDPERVEQPKAIE